MDISPSPLTIHRLVSDYYSESNLDPSLIIIYYDNKCTILDLCSTI